MKRIIIILSAIVLLAACQKENRIQEPELSTVTYSVTTPVEFEIKSAGEASEINVLWYGVYHKKENGEFKYMSDMSAFVDVIDRSSIQVPITLINNQVYRLVFVAQHKSESDGEYVYNIGENGVMTLNPEAEVTDGEQMDAFVYWEETGVITQGYNKEINLSRPLAQINVGTTAQTSPASVNIKVKGVAASYDIFSGAYSQDVTDMELKNLACSGSQLAVFYVIPPVDGKVDLEIAMDQGAEPISVTGLDVAPNFKTNLIGNI